jgi:hypothetical protein
MPTLPTTVDELTPEWFSAALGTTVSACETTHIVWGTATKVLMRLMLPDGPRDVCVKGGFDERLQGYDLGTAYELEARFYGDIASTLTVTLPRAHYAAFDAEQGQGVVILDDLVAAGCTFGDPEQPWAPDAVAAALEAQAAWARQTWGASTGPVASLDIGSTTVRDACAVLLSDEHIAAHFAQDGAPDAADELRDGARLRAAFAALWRRDAEGELTLAHGDAHVGNTYIDRDGAPSFLDWQAICRAPALYDVAYFIGGALTVADRRTHEHALLEHYLQALAAGGGPRLDRDAAWLDYRRYTLHGYLWAVTPAVMQPLERVRAMAERHLAAIDDHDPFAVL